MDNLKHPAFIICIALFAIHQLFQKIVAIPIPFLDSYLDPFLSIPIFLSLLLEERRWLLRQPDFNFTTLEVVIITTVLAIIFEEVFPRISDSFTRDNLDYVFYFFGGGYFSFFINEMDD